MRIVIKPLGLVCLVGLAGLACFGFMRIKATLAPASSGGNQADTSSVVYDDQLQNGWVSGGWAKELDWTSKEKPFGDKGTSIRVHPQNFEAVYFYHEKFETAPYDRVTFAAHGGASGGQTLRVNLVVDTPGELNQTLSPLDPNHWTRVTLRLDNFGMKGKPKITGFWIQAMSKDQLPAFYLDDVRFLKPGEPEPPK